MTEINVEKLTNELVKAGIKTVGCNSNGVVWGEDGTTEIQNLKEVQAIIAAHDPMPVIEKTDSEKILDILIEKNVITQVDKDNILSTNSITQPSQEM